MSAFLFISWAPYCSRSDNIAREFNGKSYMVYYGVFGSNYFSIIPKYFFQFLHSFFILLKEMPDVVFVMAPPVFACFPVFLYCKLFSKPYVIDAHTGAFSNQMWKKVEFMQKFFCRNAKFTIVTNNNISSTVCDWGGRTSIVPDVHVEFPQSVSPELPSGFNITFVNSFSTDEPLAELLDAAKCFNNISFHITGKINEHAQKYIKQAASNVFFTDFLPYEKYYGLLKSSDLIMAMTKNNDTMQRGAYEAIYLGKPVITSDWEILRKNFPIGALFVDNSVSSIIDAITRGQSGIQELTMEAAQLKIKKIKLWEKNKAKILSQLKDN